MDIHRADRSHRTRSLVLLAVVAVLCAAMLWQLNGWLSHMSATLATSDPVTVAHWLRELSHRGWSSAVLEE